MLWKLLRQYGALREVTGSHGSDQGSTGSHGKLRDVTEVTRTVRSATGSYAKSRKLLGHYRKPWEVTGCYGSYYGVAEVTELNRPLQENTDLTIS